MKGRKEYLQGIDREEATLRRQSERLQEKREFYNNCQVFAYDEMEAVLKHIVPMINQVEGKEYVDHTFIKKEEGHYETRWHSRLEGLPGVSGAELADTATPYEAWVEGKAFKTRMILEKETCDTFSLLSFSTCGDYKNNLSRILATKKFLEIKGIGVKAETFSTMFPYVSTFLERLVDWRLENASEEIPEDILASIALAVTEEAVAETQKGTVKQNKKG